MKTSNSIPSTPPVVGEDVASPFDTTNRRRSSGRWLAALGLALLVGLPFGCAQPESGGGDDRFGEGKPAPIEASIPYVSSDEQSIEIPTDDQIARATQDGDGVELTTIQDLVGSVQGTSSELVWYGFGGDGYPFGREKDFNRVCGASFNNKVYEIEKLPVKIRGVVTLHPRHYEKVATCGEDHRYYGSYVIQDKTGAITVIKDSLIADFTYGDRVELTVTGLAKQFGRVSVLGFKDEKVLEDASAQSGGGRVPYRTLTEKSFAEELGRAGQDEAFNFTTPECLHCTYRIMGKVCRAPTNRNFNEFTMRPPGKVCPSDTRQRGVEAEWTVSMGHDLGRVNVGVEKGDLVEVTGPVFGQVRFGSQPGWQFSIQATTIGQINLDPDAKDGNQ